MSEEESTCQSCGKRPASWHLTDIADGKSVQRHLCEQCYEEHHVDESSAEMAFVKLIAAMVPELKDMRTRSCPACGIDYLEFRQSMKLGCPHDYEVFAKPLAELVAKVHGATRHQGKVPAAANRDLSRRRRMRSLRRRLKQAVAEEAYELAAELRDRIGELGQDEA